MDQKEYAHEKWDGLEMREFIRSFIPSPFLVKLTKKGDGILKRLTYGSGVGNKIMENLNLFKYELDKEKSEGDFYLFKVNFGNQSGHLNYSIIDGEIKDVNLDVTGFPKTLGSNNDDSLRRVARFIHSSL